MARNEPTSVYDGKFTTAGFDMDESLIGSAEYDDVVTFTVTCRVVGVSTSETRIGSLKKTCQFKVLNVGPDTSDQMSFDDALGEVHNGKGWQKQRNMGDRESRAQHPAGSAILPSRLDGPVDPENPDDTFIDGLGDEPEEEIFSPGAPEPKGNVKPFKLGSSSSGGDDMLKKFLYD